MKTTLNTFTPPGHKKPWLIVKQEDGTYKAIAVLKVAPKEFWGILERELDIKFQEVSDGHV